MSLFEISPLDKKIYEEQIKDFLPEHFYDFHTHVWLKRFIESRVSGNVPKRTVSWPRLVAADNSIEDLRETYQLMFPGKTVTPLIFGSAVNGNDHYKNNVYIKESAQLYNYPALYYSQPCESAESVEENIIRGGFFGLKSYLSLSPAYIPASEIRIFDFFPKEHLAVADKYGLIVMLHLPRPQRLRDKVNICQIVEIGKRYPNLKLIIAHVGRAYCLTDLGDAFSEISPFDNLFFDISANCNQEIFERLIDAVGPKRILFGSDLPILRMKTKRICENGNYVNLVPSGLYGDVSGDIHMREVHEEENTITFFMYEEILAFKAAAAHTGLKKSDIEDIFVQNAEKLLSEIRWTN